MRTRARKSRTAAAALGALLFAFALSAPAGAAPTGAETPSSKGAARYEEGLKQFDAGNYAAAADAFLEAYEATKLGKHLWNLALAEYRSERILGALGHLRQYIDAPDANPTNVPRARDLIEELRAKTTRVTVKTDEGAEVLVDETPVGTAPLGEPLELDPERAHTIRVRSGAREAHREVARAGATSIDLVLPLPPPPAEPVRVTVPPPPPPTTSAPPVGSWVLVGVSAAALAAGIVFSVDSSAKHDDVRSREGECANPRSAACQTVRDLFDAGNRSGWIGVVSYGVSALSLGAALLVWHPWSRGGASERRSSLQLTPAISRDRAGLDLRLGF